MFCTRKLHQSTYSLCPPLHLNGKCLLTSYRKGSVCPVLYVRHREQLQIAILMIHVNVHVHMHIHTHIHTHTHTYTHTHTHTHTYTHIHTHTHTHTHPPRIIIGAPKGTYPGGLDLADPGLPASNQSGLIFSCPISPGLCEGVTGDPNTFDLPDVSVDDDNGTGDGRLFDHRRKLAGAAQKAQNVILPHGGKI